MVLLLVISFFSAAFASEQSLEIPTPRGKILRATISFPEGSDNQKLPAIVAAPGKGYHQNLPIFMELRARGPEAGYAVLTFDWNYFTENRAPSPEFMEELEDLRAAFAYARALPSLDPERIIISGKSLGSVIAYRAFAQEPAAFGLHLLTPICDTTDSLNQYYPGLASVTKPVTFVFGTADEACDAGAVKSGLAGAGGSLAILMVPGAHSFELGSFNDPAFASRNEANVKAVVGMISQWARAQFGI